MSGTDPGALATYREMVALRSRIEAGELPWSALADYFTDDAVYIDSAWGRYDGKAAITKFMDDSMAGLSDWRFPEEWAMADGDRVVSMWWNELPGQRADGSPYRVAGVSILRYAGDGKFDYEYDIFNMVQVLDVITESGWQPTGPMNPPPQHPNRDATPPTPR
ncbi:MAG: nuclear transport factor 2 family protein [Actinomycetes bacterium]